MNPIPLYDRISGAVRLAQKGAASTGIRHRVFVVRDWGDWEGGRPSELRVEPIDELPARALPMIHKGARS